MKGYWIILGTAVTDTQAQQEYGRRSGEARRRLEGLRKPLIAMIQGYCIGGGYATALMADLRIASSDSRFGIPAAKLGIAYGYESLSRLVALTGPAMAKQVAVATTASARFTRHCRATAASSVRRCCSHAPAAKATP